MKQNLEAILKDLKIGKPIVIIDRNKGNLMTLGKTLTEETLNFMMKNGNGALYLPLEKDTLPTELKNLALYEKSLDGLIKNNRIIPFTIKKGGVIERKGYGEASIDLAKLVGDNEITLICDILENLKLEEFCQENDLKMITIEEIVEYRKTYQFQTKIECEAPLPTKYGEFKIVGYSNFIDNKEHIALVYGDISKGEDILVRVHSECLTGDVLGSLKCDCGNQLDKAMREIVKNGSGVVLYLRQEGRGIGLLNKIKAYKLQAEGKDTVEANILLGFAPDLRDFSVASQMLKLLGIKSINLMTNNPKKVRELEKYGIKISNRVQIETPSNSCNLDYLRTKKEKMEHLLKLK